MLVQRLLDSTDLSTFSHKCLNNSSEMKFFTREVQQLDESEIEVNSQIECKKISNYLHKLSTNNDNLNDKMQHVPTINEAKSFLQPMVMCDGAACCSQFQDNLHVTGSDKCKPNEIAVLNMDNIIHSNRRTSKICRKGTPYPHTPSATVEQFFKKSMSADEESCSTSDCEQTLNGDSCSSVDDLDLDSVTVITNSDKMSSMSTSESDSTQILGASKSSEDASHLIRMASLFNARNRNQHNATPEELYHFHLYESIMYGKGKVPSCNIPRIPSPPPLPTRPANLLPSNHISSIIDSQKLCTVKYPLGIHSQLSGSKLSSKQRITEMQRNPAFSSTCHQNLCFVPPQGTTQDEVQHNTIVSKHQCDETICSDPDCREVCSECIASEQGSFSYSHRNNIGKSEHINNNNNINTVNKIDDIKTKNKLAIVNNGRISKLQKFGAVIRKNFLSSEIFLCPTLLNKLKYVQTYN